MLFLEFVVLVLVKILRNSDNNALTVFTFPSGQSSHFTTSSEKLAKTINDFVDAGGIAEQHPQLVRDGLRIRAFNATLIHCSLYNINSSLAPALHETPVLCPFSMITAGSVAGGVQDYTMSSLSKYQKHLDGRPSSSSHERDASRGRRVTKKESISILGADPTYEGIAKAVKELYSVGGPFPPIGKSHSKKSLQLMREVDRAVKAEKRLVQESEREQIDLDRNEKAAEAHDLRFSDAGVAASVADGIGDRILQTQVCHLVPEGSGYDSSTGDTAPLHPFTKKKQIPQVMHGIPGGCVNRIRGDHNNTGSFAAVGFSRATGSSVAITDGGASDECAGIIRSATHRQIVQLDPDLSSSGET